MTPLPQTACMRLYHANRLTRRHLADAALGALVFAVVSCAPPRPSAAQAPRTCVAHLGPTHRAILADGRTVTASSHTVGRVNDTVVVLGTPARTWARPSDSTAVGSSNRGLIGLTRAHTGDVALVRAPSGHESARGIRAARSGLGWDVVFFHPDSANPGKAGQGENGTLWFARLEGSRWSGLQQITTLSRAEIHVEAGSPLLRHRGSLYLAIAYGTGDVAGGVLLAQRRDGGSWRVDSVSLPFSPMYVTVLQPRVEDREVEAYFVAPTFDGKRILAGPLSRTGFSAPRSEMRMVVRSSGVSMVAPRVHWVGTQRVASWWEGGSARGEPPRLWASLLDSRIDSATSRRMLVASGTSEFVAIPLTVDRHAAMLWLYRPGASSTQIAATVLLDGKLLPLPALTVPNQGFLGAAPAGGASADLITASLPTPGTSERPVTLITQVTLECIRVR